MPLSETDKSLYDELAADQRDRLPNGYWARLGPDGACELLRRKVAAEGWDVEDLVRDFQRQTLVEWRLGSAATIHYKNVPLDYLRDAFPQLRRRKFRHQRTQVTKDDRFFDDIDSEEQAYFLGLLAADGSVTASNQVSLFLKEKDSEIVRRFGAALRLRPMRLKRQRGDMVGVVVCSAQLARGLAIHGISPNKSLSIGWPPSLPLHLERHYMRGLMDGDGSISSVQWTFVSASSAMFRAFKSRAEDVVGVRLPQNRVGTSKKTLQLSGGRNTWAFLDWLYDGATVWLQRKHQGFLEGQRDIPELEPVEVLQRHKVRRGYSVEFRCSRCGGMVRRPESSVKGRTYAFCDSHGRAEIQSWIHNQGPAEGTSPYDEKLSDEELHTVLKKLVHENHGRLPSFSTIQSTQAKSVPRAIRARGGLRAVALAFGLLTSIRQPGDLDQLEAVLGEIDEIYRQAERYPSGPELRRLGRCDLQNAIEKKHGGQREVRAAWESWRRPR